MVLDPGWVWTEVGETTEWNHGLAQWPPVAAVTRELACSCLSLISKDRESVLLTSVAPAPSVCSRLVCEMNKSQQKAPLDTV